MKVRYDKDVDAIYFDFEVNKISVDQEEIKDGIIVDYDSNNTIIGVEILDFSSKFKSILTNKKLLNIIKNVI